MEHRILVGLLSLLLIVILSEGKSLGPTVSSMDDGTGMRRGKEPAWISSGLNIQDIKYSIKVSTLLYDIAQLLCVFPFVEGPEGLTMAWKKKEKDKAEPIIIHSFMNGREHHLVQDSRYEGRTELSTDFSHGDLGLKLRGVTFADAGTYYCLAANDRNRGALKVELSISGLNVESQVGTLSEVDGKKLLTCITIGMFRDPWVRWYDMKSTNLTEYESHHMTDLANGMKKVESVLKYDDEMNSVYTCQVGEGILSTTVHIVRSDGKDSVRFTDPVSDPPGYSISKKYLYR